MKTKMKRIFILALTSILFSISAFAAIIFSDNYDNSGDTGWNCSKGVRTGYSGQSSCSAATTINGVSHYLGEISTGGRSGNSLKLWRSNGGFKDYGGYLDKSLTSSEFNNHYKELYVRWYVKIPTAWDANLAGTQTHKLNRFYYGSSAGTSTGTLYVDVKGDTFKSGQISIYPTNGLGWVWKSQQDITQLGLNDGLWHSIEIRAKIDPSAGGFQVWIDGTVINICDGSGNNCGTNHTNINTGAANEYFTSTLPPAIGNLTEGTWNFPANNFYAFEFDDYVVSTTYIGPDSSGGGGGSTTAPIISNVSGTVSTGQTLTINGSNLVQETTTNWHSDFKTGTASGFEGSSYSADGWVTPGDINSYAPVYDSSVKLSGSKSVKFRIAGAQPAGAGGLTSYLYRDNGSQDIWIRGYVKLYSANNLWAISHSKMIDWQGTGTQVYFQPGASDSVPTNMIMAYDGTSHSTSSSIASDDTWHLFELHWKSTSPRVFTAYWDNVLLGDASPSSIGSMSYILLGFINAAGTSSGFDATYWFDNFVVSSSRVYPSSTIEISGDGSTWKYQYPVFLSDTSSQIKVNLSGVTGTSYRLRVTNNAQQTSAIYTLSGGGGGGDTQAPSVPAGLAASVISSSQINLSWSASTDNVGVTGYKIYRGGTLLTTTTSRTYNNTGLAASTAYSYRVSAIDAAGNESSQCTAVSATTQAAQVTDTTKPSVPAGLSASVISSSQINLSWSASTDNVGVTGYKIYRGGTLLTTTTSRTYNNTGLAASTAYSYRVSAIDAAGNESSQCTAVSATTQAPQVTDTTKPSVPAGLSVSVISSSQINLSWSASTDNVGVTGYKIYRGGTLLTTTTSRTHNDTGLSASTAYSYRVSAIDAAGNESSQCTAVSATTQAGSSAGAILFQENFDNNSLESRGWYDFGGQATVVSGGQSGNCLQWAWAQGASSPTNTGTMRKLFTATDSLYVSFYVKFQSGWRGSQRAYHPHMILIPSNLDSEYTPLANNYLNTYIEFISDVGSPYTIRPQLAIQDEKRVNTSNGTPPNNLTAITENRSVAYCNTPVSSGASGTCYADNPYYSANTWKAASAAVSTNVWHHVEVYFKMNTISGGKGLSNGIMQKWIDGTLVINKSDVLYRTNQDATKKWAQFVLGPYIGDSSPIAQSMWIDELTVGTAAPGNAPPKAPTGFSVKGP